MSTQKLTCSLVLFTFALPVFSQTRTAQSTEPSAAGANLPAQRIGVNDLVAVSVYDAPEFTRTIRVGPDGAIRIPMLRRRIAAEGLMPADLETAIAAALKAEEILVDPYVTVTISEYQSRPISVAGAVRSPATFQATQAVTLLEAITRAGGLSPEAGPEILVTRTQPGGNGAQVAITQRVLVKALIDAADPSVNVALAGGEEIRVPEAGKVFVVGNVKRPGAFALQDNAETTVLKALAMSEGLMPFAARQAFIYRREGAASQDQIAIELKQIMDRKSPDVPLLANDILYIPDNKGRRLGLAALEKILLFGSTAGATALVYGQVR